MKAYAAAPLARRLGRSRLAPPPRLAARRRRSPPALKRAGSVGCPMPSARRAWRTSAARCAALVRHTAYDGAHYRRGQAALVPSSRLCLALRARSRLRRSSASARWPPHAGGAAHVCAGRHRRRHVVAPLARRRDLRPASCRTLTLRVRPRRARLTLALITPSGTVPFSPPSADAARLVGRAAALGQRAHAAHG